MKGREFAAFCVALAVPIALTVYAVLTRPQSQWIPCTIALGVLIAYLICDWKRHGR